ncbi:MAG: hypothetical protein V3R93_07725, partial [Candidatus Hydrothermarchaeaceae archaeon]
VPPILQDEASAPKPGLTSAREYCSSDFDPYISTILGYRERRTPRSSPLCKVRKASYFNLV